MRLHRRHAIRAGLILGVGTLVGLATLLFSPPVETALLRRSLARAGATDIRLQGVRFWLRHGSVALIAFRQYGVRYELHDFASRYHPLAALRHEIDLERVTARSIQVTLDLAAQAPAPPLPAPSPAGATPGAKWTELTGGMPAYRLPWKVRIRELALGGAVRLEQNGTPVGAAQWTLQGSLAPGKEGAFTFAVQPAGALFTAASGSIAAGAARLHEDASGGIDGYALSGKVDLGGGAAVAWDGAANAAGSQLRIEAKSVPLAWANPYLGASKARFTSGTLSGALRASFRDGTVNFSSEGNLHLDGIQVAMPAPALPSLPGVTGQVGFDGSWSPRGHVVTLRQLHVDAAAGAARVGADLGRSFAFDLQQPRQALDLPPATDLLRLTVAHFPLEPANRWLPGREIHGEVAQAAAVLRSAAGGAFALEAPAPWHFDHLVYTAGGRRFFRGEVEATPSVVYGPSEQRLRLGALTARDDNGTLVTGLLAAQRAPDETIAGDLALDVRLPHFPGLPEKRGEYHARLTASARISPSGVATFSPFSLQLTGQRREELVSFAAAAPVQVERGEGGEWLLQSAQPLAMKTARVPLAGLNPWLGPRGWRLDGAIPATQFNLILQPRHLRIEPATAIMLSRVHLEHHGEIMVGRAGVTVTPSFEAEIRHRFFPSFRLQATAAAAVSHGVLGIEGVRAGLFDAQVRLAGDEVRLRPTDLSGGGWCDLGAIGRLALLAHQRFPGAGHLRLVFGRSPTDAGIVEFHGAVEDVRGRDGRAAPTLRLKGRARADVQDRNGGFAVDAILEPVPAAAPTAPARASDAHFGLRVDLAHWTVPKLNSRLTSTYLNVDTLAAFAAAFAPATLARGDRAAPAAAPPAPVALPPSALPGDPDRAAAPDAVSPPAAAGTLAAGKPAPPWGVVEGRFTLAVKELSFAPYTMTSVGGTLEADASHLALQDLSGDLFGGHWSASLTAGGSLADSTAPARWDAHFAVKALDAGQAVRLRFPQPAAGIDGKVDFDLTLTGRAESWDRLFGATSGRFSLSGQDGKLRLTLPKQEMMSEALLVGGTLTFSREMRALGRLLKTIQSLPMEALEAGGTLAPSGELQLTHLKIKSPQLQLDASGVVANAKVREFLIQPLHIDAALAARGDLATLLDGMHLLDAQAVNGYRSLQAPFTILGQVGQPDLHPFYDLLAKAVQGSHGSWGLLMRAAVKGSRLNTIDSGTAPRK